MSIRSVIVGRGVVGLAAVMLVVGGGSAVAMAATGSANPVELGQRVADIVPNCKDQIRTDDKDVAAEAAGRAASTARNNRGIGRCVSAQVNHNQNGEAHQQTNGVKDADERKADSPTTSPGTEHQDHGQGGPGHGTGDGHGKPGDHGHKPTPHP